MLAAAFRMCGLCGRKETIEHEDSSIIAGLGDSPEMRKENEIKESQDNVKQKEELLGPKNPTREENSPGCDQTQGPSTVKRNNKVVGLWNIGCTCYFNALLQTLHLAPEFTSLLKRWNQMNLTTRGKSLPRELHQLFDLMDTTPRSAVSAEDVLLCLYTNLRRANVQQDSGELFLTLFNLLLDQLQDPQILAEMKAVYEIRVEQFVKCLVCGVLSERHSRMLSLPLQVPERDGHQNHSLEESLEVFFEPQNLTGRNKCFCWKCEKRTAAQQGFKLFSLPSIVSLHLKRFRHHAGGFTHKINSRVEFSEMLDFSKFPISEKAPSQGQSQSDWVYELYAVIVHMGSAHFGHYVAYVKYFEDKKWYLINDACVRPVQWEDVKGTFGSNRDCCSAYLLLYRKAERGASSR